MSMPPSHNDHTTDHVPSLAGLWSGHWGAMVLAGVASLCALGLVYALSSGSVRETMVRAVGVQLMVMAVVMPLAAAGGESRIEVLGRGGAVNDAFGLGLLLIAVFSEVFTLLAALKLYLLVSAVGLVCLGVFCLVLVLGASRFPKLLAGLMSGGVALAIWGVLFVATGRQTTAVDLETAWSWQRLVANADLHAAVMASVGLKTPATPWYGVLAVYAAAAGLIWTLPSIIPRPVMMADESPPENDEIEK